MTHDEAQFISEFSKTACAPWPEKSSHRFDCVLRLSEFAGHLILDLDYLTLS